MTLIALAIASLAVATLCYIAQCAVSPFGPCRKCRGMGHQVRQNRRGQFQRGKDCRRCKATGRRIRVGRHLLNRWNRVHHDGTR